LLLRQRTGVGSRIDVSMLEALTEWMGFPLYYAFEGAEPPARTGASHASIYPYGPFRAGDGGTVMLGLQNEREWKVFCAEVLGDQSPAPREPGRPARADRAGVRRPRFGAGTRAPRQGRNRAGADEHDGRSLGPPAARGPRGLGAGRIARGPDSRASAAGTQQ